MERERGRRRCKGRARMKESLEVDHAAKTGSLLKDNFMD